MTHEYSEILSYILMIPAFVFFFVFSISMSERQHAEFMREIHRDRYRSSAHWKVVTE